MKNQRQFFQGLFGDSSCLITIFHHYFTTTHLTCLLSHCCCSPPIHSLVKQKLSIQFQASVGITQLVIETKHLMHNQVLVTELSCIVQVVPIFVQTHSDMPCMHVFIVFAVSETECARWQCWTDISTTNIHNLKKKNPLIFTSKTPLKCPNPPLLVQN